eukprot:3811520-Alexandrium_andersonii.AAC.1
MRPSSGLWPRLLAGSTPPGCAELLAWDWCYLCSAPARHAEALLMVSCLAVLRCGRSSAPA